MLGDAWSDERLDAIEHWFVARGLPHFVERRASAWVIWSRAIPLLGVFYVAVGLNALDLQHWSVGHNVAVALVVAVVLGGVGIGANVVRGRRALQLPTEIGPVELAILVVAPVVPSLVLGQWGDAAQTLVTTAVALTAIWLITSYGVVSLLGWAVRRARSQILVLFNVIVRALPLLLLFTAFLFISTEVWQVAGTLYGPAFWLVLLIFFALGSLFLISRVPPLLRRLNTFESWDEIDALADASGVGQWLPRPVDAPAPPDPGRLLPRQRFNAGLVALFPQAIQIILAVIALAAFFVVFGVLAIPRETITAWTTTETLHTFATFELGGRELVLSEPLVRVAAFLGAFTGMYFTVVLSTDATYREEFVDDIGPELRRALAVRVLYRRCLTGHDGSGHQDPPAVRPDDPRP